MINAYRDPEYSFLVLYDTAEPNFKVRIADETLYDMSIEARAAYIDLECRYLLERSHVLLAIRFMARQAHAVIQLCRSDTATGQTPLPPVD